jgi:predicted dehydrogenase
VIETSITLVRVRPEVAMAQGRDNERIRYAVVGAGNVAQIAALPAFELAAESSQLVAIVGDDADTREALGAKYQVATAPYAELEAILGRERVQAVYVAVPNTFHLPFVERAAKAGVHVLCEKPMATTSEDCHAMIDACDAAGVHLMIAYRLHFEAANLEAVRMVRSGTLGEPRYFNAVFSQQVREDDIRTRAETGGGALFDMGVYCVNAARYLLGSEPVEVVGYQRQGDRRFRAVDEMTTAILRFPDDRVAQFTASLGAAQVDAFRIVGTEGDLRVEPGFGFAVELTHYLTLGGKTEQKKFARRDQFAAEITHFSTCLKGGRRPEPSGWEGLADVRVMEAIRWSAQTGDPVSLEPFSPGSQRDPRAAMRRPPIHKPETVPATGPNR